MFIYFLDAIYYIEKTEHPQTFCARDCFRDIRIAGGRIAILRGFLEDLREAEQVHCPCPHTLIYADDADAG